MKPCYHQNPESPDTCDACEPEVYSRVNRVTVPVVQRPELDRIRREFQTLADETDVELDELLIPMRAALTVVRDALADTPTVTYRPHIETR